MKKTEGNQDRSSNQWHEAQLNRRNQREIGRGFEPVHSNLRNQNANPHALGFNGYNNTRNPRNQSFNPSVQGFSDRNNARRAPIARGKEVWGRKSQTETSKEGEERGMIFQDNQGVIRSIHLQPVGNGWLNRSASHVKKGNQVTAAQGKEDQQSTVQKSAEILNQVVVEENNNEESSHSTQGFESFVRESIVSDTEDEHISPTIKAQEWEAQVIECAEVVRQQQEIERNALALNSPVVIDSNIRASQIQGINIEVGLQSRDTKKASRKARRRNLYEGSLSLSDNEYYEEYVSDSDLDGQEQDITSDELRTTIALGNTLEIDFAKSDILK
ncbi:hypothetical protein RHMOL_Rhmol01G0048200 [Rhododendron molle]|uniref:Uncharacterized protein n=1 Tax=Rhododendron molle TaxID=49168 RepID=A0ACC0PZK6_RHOML|nr:hypothetical protein RHMOL_Rhmol01G0048200 [Rhododendron molle]